MKRLHIAALLAVSFSLTACLHKPSPQSNLMYYAPAQAYSLDLGSQAFRGEVTLRDSCTPEGSSLDLTDNDGRFFRVDAVNLINNPNIELPEFTDDPTVRDLVLRYYTEQVNAGSRVIERANVNSRMGPALYSLVEIAGGDTPRYLGYLIARRGNFAYVLQHVQNSNRPRNMRTILGLVASEIQIPGRLSANKEQSDTPMYIDLKNATPEQIAEWKKLARCI
jgi:hypothetical protein